MSYFGNRRRGRRVQFDEPMRTAIRVRVTPAQHEDLRQVALENRSDIATVIREAVNGYVADYRESRMVFRGPQIKT